MANPSSLVNFNPGLDNRRNLKGRPKKPFHRDKFTDEFFLGNKEEIRSSLNRILSISKKDEPWALKLIAEYFLTKPKNDDSDEPDATVHGAILDKLDEHTTESKIAIRELFIAGHKEAK